MIRGKSRDKVDALFDCNDTTLQALINERVFSRCSLLDKVVDISLRAVR